MPASRKKTGHSVSSSKLRVAVEKVFEEFPDMDQRKDGLHEPHLYTANHILRKVLTDIDPEMAHSYEARSPYWTKENVKKAYKALTAFYKERGILARKFKKLTFSRTPESMRIEKGKTRTRGRKSGSAKRKSKRSKSSKRKSSKSRRSRCPAGKVRNPATGRCVDAKGPVGRKLMKHRSKSSKGSKKGSRKGCNKPCAASKICNPATGRCVSRTGALGKRLVKK